MFFDLFFICFQVQFLLRNERKISNLPDVTAIFNPIQDGEVRNGGGGGGGGGGQKGSLPIFPLELLQT